MRASWILRLQALDILLTRVLIVLNKGRLILFRILIAAFLSLIQGVKKTVIRLKHVLVLHTPHGRLRGNKQCKCSHLIWKSGTGILKLGDLLFIMRDNREDDLGQLLFRHELDIVLVILLIVMSILLLVVQWGRLRVQVLSRVIAVLSLGRVCGHSLKQQSF